MYVENDYSLSPIRLIEEEHQFEKILITGEYPIEGTTKSVSIH